MMGMLGFWLIMGIVVAILAASKGRGWPLWLLYGFVIWPVALVHALVMAPTPEAREERARRQGLVKCPHCAEMIEPDARVCPHCQRDLSPADRGPDP